jgi:hypothetical protein
MNKLYQLTNGSWVAPDSVAAIMPFDASTVGVDEEDGQEVVVPPRVIVFHSGLTDVLVVEDMLEAYNLATRLGNEINELRA